MKLLQHLLDKKHIGIRKHIEIIKWLKIFQWESFGFSARVLREMLPFDWSTTTTEPFAIFKWVGGFCDGPGTSETPGFPCKPCVDVGDFNVIASWNNIMFSG